MRKMTVTAFLMAATLLVIAQQKVIPLYNGAAPGSENWTYNEQQVPLPSHVAYNVSHPTLTVFPADPAIATGTAVIVCPGGGFYILATGSEGSEVAHWLNQKGVTVFMLKYRLGKSLTDDPVKEMSASIRKPDFAVKTKPVIEFAIADGREAIRYVRAHAAEYGVSPDRIGIMGFSAGGTVAASAAFNYQAYDKPNFVAPVYPYIPAAMQGAIAADEPPLFVTVATDDGLGLTSQSIDLYNKWLAAKLPAELHIYEKGGHGFGMNKQNIPTDTWIDRFGDWLGLIGMLTPVDPKVTEHLAQNEKNMKYGDYLIHKDWSNLSRYADQNTKVPAPAPGEKRVVFMGNSITDGWINADPSFFAGKNYYDRGISGQTTGQMLVRFREDVINLKPSVVVILAGINDIAENNGPSKVEDTFGNLQSMAQMAKASHIKVVLSSVLPAYSIPWRPGIDPKPKVAELNKMMKAYCMEENIIYLDYYTAMADQRQGLPKSLSFDGVHPTLAGYKVMEPLAEKAIDEATKKM